jgi:1,2-diacylglycerol 3-beta-galactosyltransferase
LTERTVYPFVRRRVALALAASRPDLVISVHPLQTSVPLRALRAAGSRAPFITVVTDPVSAPAAWFCPEVDLCIVATDEVRASALAAGLRPGQVRVIGLPVRRAFCTVRDRPKPDARGRLGLDPTLPLVLVTGGGAGIGRTLPVAQAVAGQLATPWRGSLASSGQDGASTSQTPAQIAIIAGRNLALLRHLRAEPWPIPVTVLGFVENMADWLAAADLLITKAGPGTLAEAACVGVPVIVTDFVPGQEEGNVTWVERSGFGRFVRQPQQIAALVSRWLRPDNPILAEMAVRARAAAWPEAAAQIADAVLALCRRATM